MKKITIALMCMILASGAAMAQKTFTLGPKVGVDYTHYWGKNIDHGGQLNYQAGLFMEYRFTDKFSIAPEVVFAAQGGKYDYLFEGVKYDATDHVNYINVPVMLKFYVVPSLSIDLGPQVGFNIYSKETDECEILGVKYKDVDDYKDITRNVEFGVGLGLTYNITEDVFVQGRYTMGVTKVFEEAEYKNGNAQIAIGYRF